MIVAIIVISVIVISFVCSSLLLVGNVRAKYKAELEEANNIISENQRYVYEVVTPIEAGELISEENVEKKLVYSSQPEELFATLDDIGKQVAVNISEGTQLMKAMILTEEYEETDRETEYEAIKLSLNLALGDYVDIRICYPNGEDYIVLSKKQIKQIDQENVLCYIWNNEEEILTMSSAIVDAYLYEGAYLYTTKYVQAEIQEPSEVTYIPTLTTMQLLESDPNIVEIASKYLNKVLRKELENRLAASMATSVDEISWQIETNTSNTTSNEEISEDDFTYYEEQEEAKQMDQELGPDESESAVSGGE